MSLFAITLRIEDDATYDRRYASVDNAIRTAAGEKWWNEPTSFYLIESTKNSQQLADFINATSEFDEWKDLLLVVNLSQKGYHPLGRVSDADLHTLMKKR